jgi:hypothetical protein
MGASIMLAHCSCNAQVLLLQLLLLHQSQW